MATELGSRVSVPRAAQFQTGVFTRTIEGIPFAGQQCITGYDSGRIADASAAICTGANSLLMVDGPRPRQQATARWLQLQRITISVAPPLGLRCSRLVPIATPFGVAVGSHRNALRRLPCGSRFPKADGGIRVAQEVARRYLKPVFHTDTCGGRPCPAILDSAFGSRNLHRRFRPNLRTRSPRPGDGYSPLQPAQPGPGHGGGRWR